PGSPRRPRGLTPPSSRPGPTSPECCSTSTNRSRGRETMNARPDPTALSVHRRAFLGRAAQGVGAVALASLLEPSRLRALGQPPGEPFPALTLPRKARRVIWLTMAGGPSQFETFDPKPGLARVDGQPMPESFTRGQQLAQLQGQRLVCLAPMFRFRKYGRHGTELSELFPKIGSVIDEICLVRSVTTEASNHDPAHMFMNTGSQTSGPPSNG